MGTSLSDLNSSRCEEPGDKVRTESVILKTYIYTVVYVTQPVTVQVS